MNKKVCSDELLKCRNEKGKKAMKKTRNCRRDSSSLTMISSVEKSLDYCLHYDIEFDVDA